MQASQPVRAITGFLSALLLAACGSTVVPTSDGALPGVDSGTTSGSPFGTGGEAVTGSGGDVSGGSTGAAGGGSTGVSPGGAMPGGGAPATTTGARVGSGPLTGRGFTAKEIYLGFGTQDDVNKTAVAAGFEGVTFGDTKAQVRAVLKYVNDRGGVLGRKLVPVFKDASTASTAPVEAQGACTAWTQDRKVFAVMNPVGRQSHDTLFACLNKAQTPVLRYLGANVDEEDLRRFEQYAPANISGRRFAPVWVNRLKAMRYFTGWDARAGAPGTAPVKVGLVLKANHDRLRPHLEAALRQAGFPASEVFVAAEGAGPQDYQSPVLRFAAQGITHVIAPSADVLYFMTYADSQQYRPRHAMSSWQAPGALLQITAPRGQLNGSMGVGYVPAVDVDNANDPGDVSPTTTLCRKIMRENGQDTTVRLTFLVMLAECDMVFLLQRALTAQGQLTNSALRVGIEALGSAFASGMTFKAFFSPTQHDGGAVVRDLAYGGDCGCFRYTGPPIRI